MSSIKLAAAVVVSSILGLGYDPVAQFIARRIFELARCLN